MCEACDWKYLVDVIDHMRTAGGYEFADNFLASVASHAMKNQHVSDKQRAAVFNIKEGRERPRRFPTAMRANTR